MPADESLIPKHGGYRTLKSFQLGQLIYDITVRFCNRFIDRRSRTHDQMVQAARSGVQNIAEGSQVSGTSKKMELKLTNVARASLEELRLDYEDFLRQRGLELWPPDHPALMRFKAKRCASLDDIRDWINTERQRCQGMKAQGQTQTDTDDRQANMDNSINGMMSVPVRDRLCRPIPTAEMVANAALSLLNLCCYFLDRQLAVQAHAFEEEGGFTERLYNRRQSKRQNR